MNSRFWFIPVLILGAIADLVTKAIAFKHIGEREAIQVISGFLSFVRSVNTGGLFGMMQGWTGFLAAMSVIAFGVIIWFLFQSPPGERWTPIALGLIGAGAAGNFYDRILHAGVRDFIDVHIGNLYHWPTFNLADVFICIGAGMIVYAAFKQPAKPARKAA